MYQKKVIQAIAYCSLLVVYCCSCFSSFLACQVSRDSVDSTSQEQVLCFKVLFV